MSEIINDSYAIQTDAANKTSIVSENTEGAKAMSDAQLAINKAKQSNDSVGELSDGYHTFNELYHHRSLLFLSLCLTSFKNVAWKSLLHYDPNEPMYNGMFILGIDTPYGQATYHYDIDPYWFMAKKIKEVQRAPKFDGHTSNDAIERIFKFASDIANGSLTRTVNITEPTLIPPATTINIKNDPTIRSILQDASILNQQDEVIMTDPPQFK